jgi:hypothetical protein
MFAARLQAFPDTNFFSATLGITPRSQAPACTDCLICAAVTSAALDSAMHSGSE